MGVYIKVVARSTLRGLDELARIRLGNYYHQYCGCKGHVEDGHGIVYGGHALVLIRHPRQVYPKN